MHHRRYRIFWNLRCFHHGSWTFHCLMTSSNIALLESTSRFSSPRLPSALQTSSPESLTTILNARSLLAVATASRYLSMLRPRGAASSPQALVMLLLLAASSPQALVMLLLLSCALARRGFTRRLLLSLSYAIARRGFTWPLPLATSARHHLDLGKASLCARFRQHLAIITQLLSATCCVFFRI